MVSTKGLLHSLLCGCSFLLLFPSLCAVIQSKEVIKLKTVLPTTATKFFFSQVPHSAQLVVRGELHRHKRGGKNEAWPEPVSGGANFREIR